jgi:hypothetical protein
MKRELKRLKAYLGRVHRDVARKIAAVADAQARRPLHPLMGLVERLLTQHRQSKDKLYSRHAPEVVCPAKGKAHKRDEFGAKVALAVINREGMVLAAQALPGNPYDGHTLAGTVEQIIALAGVEPERLYVDKGYRGHDCPHRQRVFHLRTAPRPDPDHQTRSGIVARRTQPPPHPQPPEDAFCPDPGNHPYRNHTHKPLPTRMNQPKIVRNRVVQGRLVGESGNAIYAMSLGTLARGQSGAYSFSRFFQVEAGITGKSSPRSPFRFR